MQLSDGNHFRHAPEPVTLAPIGN
ncbi:hypothetical protein NOVOSPHI9U_290006 [Novosphingobium sp. 9U]|nr:hypothetical protein NOVOSPHI9U_290006 [Novosphingobium sp. 9U]